MAHGTGALPQFIPSPPINSFHIGPLDVHFYALGYIIGITLAILITRRRWRALGGDPDLVNDIALWVVPAGIIGGRILRWCPSQTSAAARARSQISSYRKVGWKVLNWV